MNLFMLNESLIRLINSIEKCTLTIEQKNFGIIDKNNQMNQSKPSLDYTNYNKIPNVFEYLESADQYEPLFNRRSFEYYSNAFKLFLVAVKKRRVSQKEAISQALFMYAYLNLTEEELANIRLSEAISSD